MLIDTDDIINSTEIAKLFGVKQPAVSNWKRRYEDFPKPVHSFMGYGGVTYSLYLRSEVVAWYGTLHTPDDIQTEIDRLQALKEEMKNHA